MSIAALPRRGAGVRALRLPLPPPGAALAGRRPATLPLVYAGRPLKRWRYVGVYGPDLMLCAGDARIWGVPQRWWAAALPDGGLRGRTTLRGGGVRLEPGTMRVDAPGARIDLELAEGRAPVESVSRHGRRGFVWTRKEACVPVAGRVLLDGAELRVEGEAVIDDTAGYHARRTTWTWSAGVGATEDGRRVGWNLVRGVGDPPDASERTIWIDGEAREAGPVEFAADLSGISFAEGGELRFEEWAAREHDTSLVAIRSRYRQPFGAFQGELPGGVRLERGHGVMEWHDARW